MAEVQLELAHGGTSKDSKILSRRQIHLRELQRGEAETFTSSSDKRSSQDIGPSLQDSGELHRILKSTLSLSLQLDDSYQTPHELEIRG